MNEQLQIKRDYDVWIQSFQLLFRGSSDDLTRRIKEYDKEVRTWIELGENWSLTSNRDDNAEKMRAASKQLEDLLAIVASTDGERILVPDTNAIANESDPTKYRHIAGHNTYVFLLLPTVLAELDALKNAHRNPDFREKIRRAIARIKGWRTQGALLAGVTVHKTVTVRAIGTEPDMKDSLSWLDKENRDDRIIASVLEVQSDHPTSDVILVTEDVNLLNKADLASIAAREFS
ncbi:MAG: PIN domain-containing protein [Spirochaetaceae bacterium]|nr:PIN domain-containing protein [Spirochaetaceae bacterium]